MNKKNNILKLECIITGIRSKNRRDVPEGFVEVEYMCYGDRGKRRYSDYFSVDLLTKGGVEIKDYVIFGACIERRKPRKLSKKEIERVVRKTREEFPDLE